jgi:hypothetical protein
VDNSRPLEARTAYLNGKSAEEKADILERASRQGPGPQDADWVVAKACDDAAKRIEAAAGAMGDKEREELFAALARIEELVRYRKQTAEPIISEPARYILACLIGILLSIALTVFVNGERILPSPVTITAGVALGLAIGFGYQWIASIARVRR